jgi:hypothetical protein
MSTGEENNQKFKAQEEERIVDHDRINNPMMFRKASA